MKQSHLIAYNAVFSWGATVFRIIPQLILVPFLIRSIGESGYGVYALAWSLLLGVERLEMSLQSGVIKYSAAYLAEKRFSEANKVLSSTFIFSVFFGFLSCAAILVAAVMYLGRSREMAFSLGVVGLMMPLLVSSTPYIGIIKSMQRHYIDALSRTLSQYVGLFLVVLWYQLVGPSVEALIVISAGALIIARIVQLPVAYRLVPGLCNRPGLFDWQILKMIMAFGAMIVMSALCGVANTTGVRWLTGILVSTAFVAHLAIFLMPSVLLSQIVEGLTLTIMPAASAYEATENHKMLEELFLRITRYTVVLVMAGVIFTTLLIHSFLTLWVGPEYAFLGWYALVMLCSVAILQSASCAHHMLKGFGELRNIFLAFAIGLVVIPLLMFLVIFRIWESPYWAVTAGLTLGNIACGIMQIGFCIRKVKINFWELVKQAYAHPLLVSVPILIFAIGIVRGIGIDSFVGRAGIGTMAVLLFLGGFYLIFANPTERIQCKSFAQLVLGRISVIGRAVFHFGRGPNA